MRIASSLYKPRRTGFSTHLAYTLLPAIFNLKCVLHRGYINLDERIM